MSIHTRFAFQRKPPYWQDHRPDHPFDATSDSMPDPMSDPTPNPVPTRQISLLLDDWLALFEAVKARLVAAAAAARPSADGLQHAAGSAAEVLPAPPQPALETELQECVQALDQLQRMLPQVDGTGNGNGSGTGNGTGNTGPDPALWQFQSALARTQQDLAQAHAARLEANHRALHDGLTALPNRDCFRQRLDQALARPEFAAPSPALAVLYLDLDGLKLINDGHGHATGDELLRIVAARLARSVRAGDMVCRLGGDEFACLLGNVFNRDQLSHLACKLFDAVSAPLKIGDLELTVRPSIGIAVCPTDGNNSDALLRHADSAMYRAKRQQLGYAFFDASSDH